jgi:hypothetical protein
VISVLGETLGGIAPFLMILSSTLVLRFGEEITTMAKMLLNPATCYGTIFLGLLSNILFTQAPTL